MKEPKKRKIKTLEHKIDDQLLEEVPHITLNNSSGESQASNALPS
jgi:hypothetical protein